MSDAIGLDDRTRRFAFIWLRWSKGAGRRHSAVSLLFTVAIVVLIAHPATAQARFYVGGTVAAESADRGSMDLKTVPAAGGLVGWRFNDGWSIEFHLDRGFAEGDPHGRLGFFGTDTLEDSAREGFAVFAIWKSRPLGRVALAPQWDCRSDGSGRRGRSESIGR